MEQITQWKSFDGKIFPTAEECKIYEGSQPERRLVGLTEDDITLALNGENVDLANAIEKVGAGIARARIKRGELRRERKPKGDDGAAKSEAA